MTGLAERAQAAALFIRHQAERSLYGPYRGEDLARTAVRLSAALNLGLDKITTTPDTLRRRTIPGEPALATATCTTTGETYTFLARSPMCTDEPFELLAPCPDCHHPVPRAEVRHLADLGDYLARPPLTAAELHTHPSRVPDTFYRDPGHHTDCPHADIP
ncbi:hypothetical protein [Streptomyces sp. NPDC050738]|uniref:hypothetical protein n=1 Tax=Streptomyces sp. NPDC050738 TaxID=3154744 RepID=UPI0034484DB2